MLRCALGVVGLLVAGSGWAGDGALLWDDLPAADPGRRDALVATVVEQLPEHWSVEDGGLAPAPGAIPTFRHTAYALLALYEAPEELVGDILRQTWVRDALDKILASQVTDPAEADPSRYPNALYGSYVYPGWRPESEWPWPRSRYEWDMFVPPPLLTLLARHGDQLPEGLASRLRSSLWIATDGVLTTWYAVRDLEQAPGEGYWGHTNYTLMYLQTLILGGELCGHDEALQAGIDGLGRWLRFVRQRGVHEYASPTYVAVDLDALGHLAQLASRPDVGRAATAAWLYLWTDLTLTLTGGANELAMGGPASRSYGPLGAGGGHQTHLWLAGLTDVEPPLDPVNAYRGVLERRPPQAIRALAGHESPHGAVACWGDRPGQHRSWWREPGLLVGASAAAYGAQDRGLAVDLPRPLARVHLSADRGDGSGGLPSGAGTGHPRLYFTVGHHRRAAIVSVETVPYPEERNTLVLFLPRTEETYVAGVRVALPEPGSSMSWPLSSPGWVAVGSEQWWVVACAATLGPGDVVLAAPSRTASGMEVLRLEIRPRWQMQLLSGGYLVAAVSRTVAEDVAALWKLVDATTVELAGTPEGLRFRGSGGVVNGTLEAVYDTVFHEPVAQKPEVPLDCRRGPPLQAPGLTWNGAELTVIAGGDDVRIDLREPRLPRQGRAAVR